jgi:hypothetical protein
MKTRKAYFFVFTSVLALQVYSQKSTVLNLPRYNNDWLHFGFGIAYNSANFNVYLNPSRKDSVLQVVEKRQPGFNLIIVSELRLHEYATVRFLPELSFQDRFLNYTAIQNGDTFNIDKKFSSTLIDFPFELKIRSARLNNIAAYLVGGGRYCIDLNSDKNVVNNSANPGEIIMKLKSSDYGFEAGFGLDFYFQYFKFSVEAKGYWGLNNLLIKEENIFSKPIDKLLSKVFFITIFFEG